MSISTKTKNHYKTLEEESMLNILVGLVKEIGILTMDFASSLIMNNIGKIGMTAATFYTLGELWQNYPNVPLQVATLIVGFGIYGVGAILKQDYEIEQDYQHRADLDYHERKDKKLSDYLFR